MRALFDTHLIIWIAEDSRRLSRQARAIYADRSVQPVFSVVALWEVAIKSARHRPSFDMDPRLLRQNLLAAEWEELPVVADHVIAVAALPLLHHDPFDRLLVAQAGVEQADFLTADRILAPYGSPVRLV
jgi:PIN domain nuclease of toxin-antitoxin system